MATVLLAYYYGMFPGLLQNSGIGAAAGTGLTAGGSGAAWLTSRIVWLTLSALLLLVAGPQLRAQEQPNIVLIMTDDQPWHTADDMPFTWDLFSRGGIIFPQAISTTPLCCPSRASIQTGLYSHRHGILDNCMLAGPKERIMDDRETVGVWLRRARYTTGYFGKYMNCYKNIAPYRPPGWSVWRPTEVGGRVEEAFHFVETASMPFFAIVALRDPHAPAIGEPADRKKFQGFLWRPPSWNEEDVSDKPPWVQSLPEFSARSIEASDRFHIGQLAELQGVDRFVQKVVETLKSSGRWAHTVLAFTTDNGLSWGEHRVLDTKRCVYEECLRVPFMIRVPSFRPRIDLRGLVANIDLPVTFAELAGALPPDGLDGQSILPLLRRQGSWREEILVEYLGETGGDPTRFQGVRTARYTYAEYRDGSIELYDRKIDPFQLENVSGKPEYGAVEERLRETLKRLIGP